MTHPQPMLSKKVKRDFLATLKAEIDWHKENGEYGIGHLSSLRNIRQFIKMVKAVDPVKGAI